MRLAVALLAAVLVGACGDASAPTGSTSTASPTIAVTPAPSEPPPTTDTGQTLLPAEPSETASTPIASVEPTETAPLETTGDLPSLLQSTAFRAVGSSQRIPPKYTCDGVDVSPPLDWHIHGTAEFSEFAMVVTDPDAGGFVHWVVARIPGTDAGLDEGAGDPDAGNGLLQGQNGFGTARYRGPCPPAGTTHHYHFALYAFATAPDLSDTPTADEVTQAGGSPAVTLDAIYGH